MSFEPSNKIEKKASRVIALLLEAGAHDCLMIGGYVRDRLLGIASKDIDIEVYGLGYQKMVKVLRPHFHVGLVGRSFGTLKVDNQIDLSIPRRESKRGEGHRGFDIHPDPTMTPRDAAARRDFTVNAIGMRPDGSFCDPFRGRDDLEKGILRATTEAFCEDPLRVLRGMQFAARFDFVMEPRTIELCRRVFDEFSTLSPERLWEEWRKWAAGSKTPSRGLWLLRRTGWIDHFPELARLIDLPQNPRWHPEGDVFTHTCHVCDQAAYLAIEEKMSSRDRTVLLFAALCHDFGKALTTKRNDRGDYISHGHAGEGPLQAETFFERMRAPKWVLEHVKPLIEQHMMPLAFQHAEPTDRSVRRLAHRLKPSNIRMWATLCQADSRGCPPHEQRMDITPWIRKANQLELRDAAPQPILKGRHLIEEGISPGPAMGKMLEAAFQAQLDGAFEDLSDAFEWLRSYLKDDESRSF
jgi:tRNA nucleotidyltransferase (CCA-adding enzyme)